MRDVSNRVKSLLLLFFLSPLICAVSADIIDLKARLVTFTNLQGEAFKQVALVHGDLDGIIWRKDASGGRVCYTNLNSDLLESWGISSNRIDVARTRAQRKAQMLSRERAAASAAAQAEAAAKAKEEAEWRAGAPQRELHERKRADMEAIANLEASIDAAKVQIRRAEAAAHDYNSANAFNDYAPHVYVRDAQRVKVEEAQAQLEAMKKEFARKYQTR